MKFKSSFCDPFNPKIIDLGQIEKSKVMETFETIPWTEHLNKMKDANQSAIHYSPSLEFENTMNNNGLVISAVDGIEWYIFFKRPKWRRKFFGLINSYDENFVSDITGQSIEDVRICLKALIDNNLNLLEEKIK